MKFLLALSVALPLAAAIPKPVQNPDKLSALLKRHDNVLKGLKDGSIVSRSPGDISKRALPLVLLGAAPSAIKSITDKLRTIFGTDVDNIWESPAYCRVSMETQGGGNCVLKSYGRDSEDPIGEWSDETGCGWVDPENKDPPLAMYEDDEALGDFSIQYTATDEYAWDGVEDAEECSFQGLCNPQIVFYRDGYEIVLDTWKSQGENAKCYYSDGEDCGGLCSHGVKDEFVSNGVRWGGSCAVPCKGDGEAPDS